MLNLLHASRAGLPYMINARVAGSTSVCKDHEWGLRSFLDPRVLNQQILIMLLIQDRQLSSWKRSSFKIIAAMAIERSVLKMRPNNRKWPMSWKKKNTVGGGKDCQERNDGQKREERLVREGWLEEQHGQERAYRKNITMEGDWTLILEKWDRRNIGINGS